LGLSKIKRIAVGMNYDSFLSAKRDVRVYSSISIASEIE
jgi:hypothetical protein